jgi:hypothetical protein
VKIAELFRREIQRTIEEVVKVDLVDEATIAAEIDEYVATGHILNEITDVLEAYQESILKPNESTNVWVSGFFGSGKSSFAKVLGYLLANPTVQGRSVLDRFAERADAKQITALLNTIHAQAPTLNVMLDLATGANVVAREGESVVLPIYRALLDRLGYSRNITLAELEFALETDNEAASRLPAFEAAFAEATGGKLWADERYTILAKNNASRALHLLDPATFPHADTWAKTVEEPEINANWFATRAQKLLARRGGGATRVAFVVDEVGQYVARSVQRMLDLQGVAEAIQKQRGSLWLIVTSQERLNDVVDSLESKQVELARVQARFPVRVDLLPSDIDEVTGKRVLDKTEAGQNAVRAVVAAHRNQLAAHTRLDSPTRAKDLQEDEIVRLYPLLPYQIQLLIDAVSQRRTQGAASAVTGGSNRTLIKHAQQLVIHSEYGLGSEEVGALVTLDRSYDLLEEVIPSAWRAEITQMADKYGPAAVETRLMKAVALCLDVHALPLTAHNLAVLLHSAVQAETLRPAVDEALANLVADDRLRESDGSYRLQSPEQKDWEQGRRAIDLKPGDAVRLRRLLLKDALTGLSVTRGRSFRVGLIVEGEKLVDGDIALHIDETDLAQLDDLRATSRAKDAEDRVTWAYQVTSDTWDALHELHRSRTMIQRRDTASKTPTDHELLGEERSREKRLTNTALQRLTRDLAAGKAVFRGVADDVDGTDLRATAQKLLSDRIGTIYPLLDQFSAGTSLKGKEVLALLRAEDLSGVPDAFRDSGLGIVRFQGAELRIDTTSGPLPILVAQIRERSEYGQEANGLHLERHFAAPPYGAPLDVVQALCAAGIRAGVLEVVHQTHRISNHTDARLDAVFTNTNAFRQAAFRLPSDTGVPIEKRAKLAERLEDRTGKAPALATDALAGAVRGEFLPGREIAVKVRASLTGAGLTIPEVVTRTVALLERLGVDDDDEVVLTALDTWADLTTGGDAIVKLDAVLTAHLNDLRGAQREARAGAGGLPGDIASEHAELVDLLAAGDLADHAPRIVAIAQRLADNRAKARDEAASALQAKLEELRARIRSQYNALDAAIVDEAVRPLDDLDPHDQPDLSAETIQSRIPTAEHRAQIASHQLDELLAAGRLAWIKVTDVVAEAITSEAELDIALKRLREAIAAELANDKQVKLQ